MGDKTDAEDPVSGDDISDVDVDDDLDDYDPLDDDDPDADAIDEKPDIAEEGHGAGARPTREQDDRVPATLAQAAQAVGTRRVIVVLEEERLTSNFMTVAEVTRAIALRAEQITKNPSAYTDTGDLSHAGDIARKELYDHRSPLVLRRQVGQTRAGEPIIEKWRVREMSYPPLN